MERSNKSFTQSLYIQCPLPSFRSLGQCHVHVALWRRLATGGTLVKRSLARASMIRASGYHMELAVRNGQGEERETKNRDVIFCSIIKDPHHDDLWWSAIPALVNVIPETRRGMNISDCSTRAFHLFFVVDCLSCIHKQRRTSGSPCFSSRSRFRTGKCQRGRVFYWGAAQRHFFSGLNLTADNSP